MAKYSDQFDMEKKRTLQTHNQLRDAMTAIARLDSIITQNVIWNAVHNAKGN